MRIKELREKKLRSICMKVKEDKENAKGTKSD
jgi:hypothetical protein